MEGHRSHQSGRDVDISLFQHGDSSPDERAAFFQELLSRLEARPEIERAALGASAPWGWAPAVEFAGVDFAYGDGPPVFEKVDFAVGRGERLLVLGLNGAGKTSLLRILAGTSEADSGTLSFGHQVSVGYYAQEHEGIRAGASVLEHMAEASPGQPEQMRRRLLGMFGLSGDKVHQDASTLSGGEKTKLALSLLVAGRHNLLLLDEPTNNLDPPSREAVAAALASAVTSLPASRQPRVIRLLVMPLFTVAGLAALASGAAALLPGTSGWP